MDLMSDINYGRHDEIYATTWSSGENVFITLLLYDTELVKTKKIRGRVHGSRDNSSHVTEIKGCNQADSRAFSQDSHT
jgi:hypothetical protein